jgi:hypothetical protein
MGDERCVGIKGVDQQGRNVWYTGGAGDAFISDRKEDAFVGYTPDGAAHKASVLNRGTPFHGVQFTPDV